MGRADLHEKGKLPKALAPQDAISADANPLLASDAIPAALTASPDYEVIREINRGGMGVVYLVRNRRMDRFEALKVVKAELLARDGALERFEREMRSAARLNHQNIVTAFSAPPLEGLVAFAMEFVDGTDLYNLVKRRGVLPVSNACYYVYQTAQGLQHAHERQMVHRDIKPNNLMLTREGKKQLVKILDFGLAKASSEQRVDGGLTATGQMLGTPHYVAPEQTHDASNADVRADIYSLGCTLHYLLEGEPPFHDKGSLYEILYAHHRLTPRPLNELRRDVPVELAEIVSKMMAKDPALRYQKPIEVAEALKPWIGKAIKPIPIGKATFQPPPVAATCETVMPGDTSACRAVNDAASAPDQAAANRADGGPPPSSVSRIPPVPGPRAGDPPPLRPADPNPMQTLLKMVTDAVPARRIIGNRPETHAVLGIMAGPRVGVVACALIAGVLVALAAGVFIKIKTPEGILIIEVNEPGAEVFVDGDKATVKWDRDGNRAEVRVKPGERLVEVRKDGFEISAERLTFKDAGREVFEATLQPTPKTPRDDAVPAGANGLDEPLAAQPNDDRAVAGWILSLGGTVAIRVDGSVREIKTGETLPDDQFLVERLTLVDKSVTGDDLARLARLTALCRVELTGCRVGDAGLVQLQRLSSLKELTLARAGVTDVGLASLEGATRLSRLSFWGNPGITDAGLRSLRNLTNLKHLDLNGTRTTDEGLASLAGLTKLEYLNFMCTTVTGAGFAHLERLANLRSFDVAYAKQIGDDSLLEMRRFVNLEWLCLSGTSITDEGLSHLGDLPRLNALRLENMSVSDAGVPHLVALRKLKYLCIKGTRISAEGHARLNAAFPHAGIEWADAGWAPLFNGKDLTGWKTHPGQPGNWRVEEGILQGRGISGLYTERCDFGDFDLCAELRVNDTGHLAVGFRAQSGQTMAGDGLTSPPMYFGTINNREGQIWHPTGSLMAGVAGSTQARPIGTVPERSAPVSQWQTLEITARGNQFTVKVGGRTLVDCFDADRRFWVGGIMLFPGIGRRDLAGTTTETETVAEFRKIEIREFPRAPAGDARATK